MAISAVYILDAKGKVFVMWFFVWLISQNIQNINQSIQVLIFRNYRGDIDVNIIDRFMPLLMEREEEGSTVNAPVILYDHITFTFVNFSNLYCIFFYINYNILKHYTIISTEREIYFKFYAPLLLLSNCTHILWYFMIFHKLRF